MPVCIAYAQIILGFFIPLIRGFSIPLDCFLIILVHVPPICIARTQIKLGYLIPSFCKSANIINIFCQIISFAIEHSAVWAPIVDMDTCKIKTCDCMALLRSRFVPSDTFRNVLCNPDTSIIANTKLESSLHMSKFRSFEEPFYPLFFILIDTMPGNIVFSKNELCLGIPLFRGLAIQFNCFFLVFRHSLPLFIRYAKNQLRVHIALLCIFAETTDYFCQIVFRALPFG